jgi:plasmid maintenance system antidote protein VapI
MTLDTLLEHYKIYTPNDLAAVLGIHRAYAWQLLHGKRQFTTKQALQLYRVKGIPIHELLQAQVAPKPALRGRPRKRPAVGE